MNVSIENFIGSDKLIINQKMTWKIMSRAIFLKMLKITKDLGMI